MPEKATAAATALEEAQRAVQAAKGHDCFRFAKRPCSSKEAGKQLSMMLKTSSRSKEETYKLKMPNLKL